MRWLRSDLPLITAGSTGYFLPWLIAIMTFLAAMSLSGAIVLHGFSTQWESSMDATLTVQIPLSIDEASASVPDDGRITQVMDFFASLPGVEKVESVPRETAYRLLEPWLGSIELVQQLPVPQLIDITLSHDNPVTLAAMQKRLDDIAPGSTIDDHRVWLSKLIDAAETLNFVAWAVLGMVVVATTATIIHATRAALAVHYSYIEVLHFVGATDSYIAGQLARQIFLHAFKGGLIGLAVALPALWWVRSTIFRIHHEFISEASLDFMHVSIICLLPVLAASLSVVTARFTVRRQLVRML